MRKSLSKSIYIIDDDDSVRRALSRLLDSLGFEVSTFGSAQAFLNSLIKNNPSCVILDVHMPEMDGLELQRQLKKNGRHFPIIFITAYARDGDCDLAFSQGAVGFLTKPFAEEKLIELIQVALDVEILPETK